MIFSELVDISKLRELCKCFTAITGAATAIIDLEGNIITASGWQDICTRFHRIHPATASCCRESDTVLAGRLEKGKSYNVYQCGNGLIDVAVPITIAGEKVANFFTGQFFFEPPDTEYFIRQAKEFGFDEDAYIAALDRVPIFSEEKVKSMLEFFSSLAQLIGEMGLAGKNLEEANAELRNHQERLEELVRERTIELSRKNRELKAEIGERRQTEEEREKLSERFRILADNIAQLAWMADEKGWVFWYNKRWFDYTGTTLEEMQGSGWRNVHHPDHVERVAKKIKRSFETGELCEDTFPLRSKNGEYRWFLSSAIPIRNEEGKIVRWFGTNTDITDHMRMEDEIRHMAHHDTLTGLPNRRLFNDILKVELAQARRHKSKLAVLFLDLDRFKEVNDTLGHEAGDRLLKEVARRFRITIREADTVARIGGDEFNMILADLARAEDVSDIALKIVSSLRKPIVLDGHELHTTTSIGISIYPDDSDDSETLLRYADIAMYHAKESGRNAFRFYSPSINVKTIERMRLAGWLRQTILRGELSVLYQPQIDIKSKKISYVEALVRWNHPERGLLEPRDFIRLAEETGFITSIDEWMLGAVCSQAASWKKAGVNSFCVAVNLSARQFQSPVLVKMISAILTETGLPPGCLDLEVTESTAMSDVEQSASQLRELREMGVHISIDDFGTGYSSLNYLKKLPIERLKIDRSFVQDLVKDSDDRAIIGAVTSMAHKMGIKTVAEGVETEEQLAFLRDSDCDEAQGFLFSRPVSAEQFRELASQSA